MLQVWYLIRLSSTIFSVKNDLITSSVISMNYFVDRRKGGPNFSSKRRLINNGLPHLLIGRVVNTIVHPDDNLLVLYREHFSLYACVSTQSWTNNLVFIVLTCFIY